MPDMNVNDQHLDEQLTQVEQARPWSPRVISKLETFIRSAPDFDLFRLLNRQASSSQFQSY